MQKVKYKEKAQAGLIDDCVDPVAGVEGARGGGSLALGWNED